MTISIAATPLPLAVNADGVVLVGGTRVTLDTVVFSFNRGATAEEICLAYPSLRLADVYATIAYYLQQRQVLAREVRRQNEAKFNPQVIRERLLSRMGG
ncbi:DUF433 domain-containing protein [Kamptonema animale CS-326]|uniref:DUF433 domain-containing protein n=1 Tax=Kamptonema animale TaxID=92934 RepID=UPI00232E8C5D|nr:DUF433 domain-containing protein [Kamptonema animale]MDB9515076.1 DUF433 domain-containing protein [Kamptonema animale CS-326]